MTTPATLPTIDQIAADIKGAPAKADASAEVNVNAATPTNAAETASAGEKEVAKKEAPKNDPTAARFAALARREKESRARADEASRIQQENLRLKQDIENRQRDIEAREAAIKSVKRPMDALKAYGFDYAAATNDMIGMYEEKPVDPMDTKLDERFAPIAEENRQLKETLASLQQSMADIQSERANLQQQRYLNEINDVCKASGHELIQEVGQEAYTLVQLVQQDYQQKNGKPLSLQDACDKVEEYYDTAIFRLAQTKKIQSRLVPPAPTVPQKQPVVKKEASERPSTLTQSLSQGTRAKPDVDKMSRNDALSYLATQLTFK